MQISSLFAKIFGSAAVAAAALTFVSSASADDDRVKTDTATLVGKITATTPLSVTVQRGTTRTEAPIATVQSVVFGDEPPELAQARINVQTGAYKKAMEKLAAIEVEGLKNPLIAQEAAYYKAAAQARMALLGEGTVVDAGRELASFLSLHRTSHHMLEATELLGDLLMAAGAYDKAQERYAVLAKAPVPSIKVRAGVLQGRVLQAQGEHAEAIKMFDAALALGGDDPRTKQELLGATLGRAVSLAATGEIEEGVRAIEAVIRGADPDQQQLLATAYNALGNAHLEAGRQKDALFAFLHVDLLMPTVGGARAEALYHLGSLWEAVGKPEEARKARQLLAEQYGATAWAKKR